MGPREGEGMQKACSNCEFYSTGECRRYPPAVLYSTASEQGYERSPWVDRDYWCGEFKPSSAPAAGGE